MGGKPGKRGIPIILAVYVSIPAFLTGHPDDPKAWDPVEVYVGPGYRADLDDDPLAAAEFDSEGVELLSWLPVKDFGQQMEWASDCWGYVSESGREYAILGLSHGTGFVEITNPGAAQIIGVIDGPRSVWRDIKTYPALRLRGHGGRRWHPGDRSGEHRRWDRHAGARDHRKRPQSNPQRGDR